jgi:alpha-ketoglutarate-dependent taurine dioxygenase
VRGIFPLQTQEVIEELFMLATTEFTSSTALKKFRETLQQQGYLHLQQLPDDFEHLAFVQQFGNLIPHQYNGEYVFSIRVDPKIGKKYPAFTTREVEPHTEGYEYAGTPLHYQALWCVIPPQCGGGQTTLADGYAFIESLSPPDQTYLTQQQFTFVTPSGKQVTHPLYDAGGQQPIVRFNHSSLQAHADPQLQQLTQRFLDFFKREQIVITWRKDDLLIWDNWRMLHSRTRYRDPDRYLKRVYLQ